ncbi:MAG: hypothetical protein H0T73_22005 [Ardenticatenales bacterium]|jgi:hypothetical protein|nr:hypothetical protein [Ardenticatenales bacterium]
MTTTNRSHIAAFTHNYLFRGVVVTGTKRLSDVLNDRITAFMEIQDARVYNLARPDKSVFGASELYLKKQRVEMIAILKEEIYMTPRRIYSFVQKERRPAMLFLRSFELRGFIHLQGKHEMSGPLTREGELFVPVTEATLVSTFNQRVKISAPTVLLREAALDGFYIAEEDFITQAMQ